MLSDIYIKSMYFAIFIEITYSTSYQNDNQYKQYVSNTSLQGCKQWCKQYKLASVVFPYHHCFFHSISIRRKEFQNKRNSKEKYEIMVQGRVMNKHCTKKMKLSIKNLIRKCDQICRNLLLNKSLMENSIFCAVKTSMC